MSMENPTWVTGTLDTSGGSINLSSVAPHLFAEAQPQPVEDKVPEPKAATEDNVTGEIPDTSGTDVLGVLGVLDEPDVLDVPDEVLPPAGEIEVEQAVVDIVNTAEALDQMLTSDAEGEAVDDGQQDDLFDPGEYTVSEVFNYLATASDEEKARVLAAEASGRARKSLVE